ncbi:hypothetical protein [[Mycobacterium] burgundiense]|uniref:Uncharacterized protein n=1 Tax=[Mycobacterium] burgundiense TaxID=3064286 RepID=A0ABM9LQ22_9MYCO|nr:hypothetical protein [Mycolicibacterium sp. MU0053]CAJ1502778.1 hypothetical protein MU0053_002271 [Mycolicibacterium sp. MU0053]
MLPWYSHRLECVDLIGDAYRPAEYVTATMQAGLDELAAKRHFPILGGERRYDVGTAAAGVPDSIGVGAANQPAATIT